MHLVCATGENVDMVERSLYFRLATIDILVLLVSHSVDKHIELFTITPMGKTQQRLNHSNFYLCIFIVY